MMFTISKMIKQLILLILISSGANGSTTQKPDERTFKGWMVEVRSPENSGFCYGLFLGPQVLLTSLLCLARLGGQDPLDYISMYWNPGKPEEHIPPHWHYVRLGGQDPLDYISMYWNPGKPEEHIPPHWHYVSFGLSDLHGDGRVHALGANESGLGLELSLRLAADVPGPSGTSGASSAGDPGSSIAAPPLWPAALLQALARYLLLPGNKFCAGDHISWHAPLDGDSGSRVRHLLVVDDPQLPTIHSPHGTVHFVQMVGCTSRELKAAQRGSGFDVLKLIAEDPKCGGAWWVTRAGRRRSARGVLRPRLRPGPGLPPAPLAGVSAKLRWLPLTLDSEELTASPGNLSPSVEQQIKDTLQRGLSCMGSSTERTDPEGHMSTDSFEMSSMERALPQIPDLMQGSWCSDDTIEYLDGVHLILNAEGASLLPLAIDGRLAHGRHFTWRCSGAAATLVPCGVAAALPSLARPYAQRGAWLQVLVPEQLAREMSPRVAPLARLAPADSESDSESDEESDEESNVEPEGELQPPKLPLALHWPRYRLKITVLPDHELF